MSQNLCIYKVYVVWNDNYMYKTLLFGSWLPFFIMLLLQRAHEEVNYSSQKQRHEGTETLYIPLKYIV